MSLSETTRYMQENRFGNVHIVSSIPWTAWCLLERSECDLSSPGRPRWCSEYVVFLSYWRCFVFWPRGQWARASGPGYWPNRRKGPREADHRNYLQDNARKITTHYLLPLTYSCSRDFGKHPNARMLRGSRLRNVRDYCKSATSHLPRTQQTHHPAKGSPIWGFSTKSSDLPAHLNLKRTENQTKPRRNYV